jgi:hypothetical protein
VHFITVPETRETILLDREAKRRRKTGEDPNVYGPNELDPFSARFSLKELMHTWLRPFRMFLTEPIVLVLSLLSGFSDALIFMQIQSFSLVYTQWGFNSYELGLAFIPIGIGYVIAWISFIPAIKRNKRMRAKNPEDEHAQYESRMTWLLWTAPCLPIGLIIFAWTSTGPPIHWIGSMFGTCIIGIANYSIYMATIDYMIAAYGPYSASATGGNGWARDFLAGVLTVPATPFYSNIGKSKGLNLPYGSTILFCVATVLVIAVYVIYWKGPALRNRSPFAMSLAKGKDMEHQGRHLAPTRTNTNTNSVGEKGTAAAVAAPPRPPFLGGGFGETSRHSSYYGSVHAQNRENSAHASRNASRNPSRNASPYGSRRNSHETPHQAIPALHDFEFQNLDTIASTRDEQI